MKELVEEAKRWNLEPELASGDHDHGLMRDWREPFNREKHIAFLHLFHTPALALSLRTFPSLEHGKHGEYNECSVIMCCRTKQRSCIQQHDHVRVGAAFLVLSFAASNLHHASNANIFPSRTEIHAPTRHGTSRLQLLEIRHTARRDATSDFGNLFLIENFVLIVQSLRVLNSTAANAPDQSHPTTRLLSFQLRLSIHVLSSIQNFYTSVVSADT